MNIIKEPEAERASGARDRQQTLPVGSLVALLKRFLLLAAAFAIALPPALMAFLIHRDATETPFWDEWETVPLIVKLHTGGFTFADFWTPHNEHRMLFPDLCYLLLAKCGGWSVLREIWANFALALVGGLIVWLLLGQTLAKRSRRLGLVAMAFASLFLFSPDQGFNWVWGFQLQWYLVDVFVLLAIWAVNKWPGQWTGLGLGIVGAVVATFSLASGMCIWVAVLYGMVLRRNLWRTASLALWSVCAAISIGLYFHKLPLQSHLGYVLHHLSDYLHYVFAWLGTPIVGWDDPGAAVHVGMIGLAIFLALNIWLVREVIRRGTDQDSLTPQTWLICLPWMVLALFSLLNDAIMGYGRLPYGWQQSLSDRYTNISNFFWVGTIACLLTLAHAVYAELGADAQVDVRLSHRKARAGVLLGRVNAQVLLLAFFALITCLFLRNVSLPYHEGKRNMAELSHEMHASRLAVYNYNTAPDMAFKYLYPNTSIVRGRLHDLDVYHEGPFRAAAHL